jgi:transposase
MAFVALRETLGQDPFSGTIFVFRAKRADRIKIVAWNGSGLVLFWKRLEHRAFRWPPIIDGTMRLTSTKLAALVDGMDWSCLTFARCCGTNRNILRAATDRIRKPVADHNESRICFSIWHADRRSAE